MLQIKNKAGNIVRLLYFSDKLFELENLVDLDVF